MDAMLTTISHLISQWILSQATKLSLVAFREVIFAPVHWSNQVTELFGICRTVVLGGLAAVAGWGILATMWPGLWVGGIAPSPLRLLQRVVSVGFLSWLVVPGIQWLLQVNNAVVSGLMATLEGMHPPLTANQEVLSPLLSAIIVVATAVLLVYLGIFYALRMVEIFILTALSPIALAWWGVTGDQSTAGRWFRELLVAIFIQSVHAAVFWLYFRLIWNAELSEFEAVGVLFYMIRIPDQLRRILGVSGGRSMGMPWR